MRGDDVAWEKSEEIAYAWVLQFLEPDILEPLSNFIVRYHNPDEPQLFTVLERGGFNICLQMKYKYSSAVIRFSQAGVTMFPDEKLRNEIAIMRYI